MISVKEWKIKSRDSHRPRRAYGAVLASRGVTYLMIIQNMTTRVEKHSNITIKNLTHYSVLVSQHKVFFRSDSTKSVEYFPF
jgi:hypothetical protein